jgi:hypothetical protein
MSYFSCFGGYQIEKLALPSSSCLLLLLEWPGYKSPGCLPALSVEYRDSRFPNSQTHAHTARTDRRRRRRGSNEKNAEYLRHRGGWESIHGNETRHALVILGRSRLLLRPRFGTVKYSTYTEARPPSARDSCDLAFFLFAGTPHSF